MKWYVAVVVMKCQVGADPPELALVPELGDVVEDEPNGVEGDEQAFEEGRRRTRRGGRRRTR